MRYLYGVTDDKFVKGALHERRQDTGPLSTYKFRVHSFIKGKEPFNRNDVPIVFKASPDTLLNLAAKKVDALPLVSVFKWSNWHVCKWVRNYGYPHYQRTFRENLINGHTLLLLDAAALSAMNIKDFDDIRHIAYGIRQLFYFELTRFTRSISLAPHYHYELYKLFRVKTGRKFELTRRTDLWRQLQLLRPKTKNLSHWELLERWLAREPDPEFPELFGGVRRARLYKCKAAPPTVPVNNQNRYSVQCDCMPPCDCSWTERDVHSPTSFACLPKRQPDQQFKAHCDGCMPPCTCNWTAKKYMIGNVLLVLQEAFPQKYGAQRINRPNLRFGVPDRLMFYDKFKFMNPSGVRF